MAIFPCDRGGHRYPGAQQTIYPAIVDGRDTARCKVRLCPEHFDQAVQELELSAQNAQLSWDDAGLSRCLICRDPVTDDTAQFFATVYSRSQDRRDFWSVVHAGCVNAAKARWVIGDRDP